jgi:hypothetical protein
MIKMNLTKNEKLNFEKLTNKVNEKINDSRLELFDSFYEEDIEFRLEIINELILRLNEEKEMINNILIEEAVN